MMAEKKRKENAIEAKQIAARKPKGTKEKDKIKHHFTCWEPNLPPLPPISPLPHLPSPHLPSPTFQHMHNSRLNHKHPPEKISRSLDTPAVL
jgi:hypothetical protein